MSDLKAIKVRVFEVVSKVKNDETGEEYLTEERIKEALSHKTIKRYGWILHDDDKITEDMMTDSFREKHPDIQVGDPKALHWHIVGECSPAYDIEGIAKWFGVPLNMIDIPKGRNAFLEKIEYLTHERPEQQALGKHRYDDSEVHSNFDWRAAVDRMNIEKACRKQTKTTKEDVDYVLEDIMRTGLTLDEAYERLGGAEYIRNFHLLRKARNEYLYRRAPMPGIRHVMYVDGDGAGVGKSILSKLLCKVFAVKEYGADVERDFSELQQWLYKAGDKGVAWDKYDGQPIVLIDDRSAYDMLQEFNGHDGVKALLSNFPDDKENKNIKYGDTTVIAKYIVINGIEKFDVFLNGLNGTYTSKDGTKHQSDTDLTQYSRRITAHFEVLSQEEIVNVFLNSAIYRNTTEYLRYEMITTRAANFPKLIERLGGAALYEVGKGIIAESYDALKKIEAEKTDKITDPALIPDDLKCYGTALPIPEDRKIVEFDTTGRIISNEHDNNEPSFNEKIHSARFEGDLMDLFFQYKDKTFDSWAEYTLTYADEYIMLLKDKFRKFNHESEIPGFKKTLMAMAEMKDDVYTDLIAEADENFDIDLWLKRSG